MIACAEMVAMAAPAHPSFSTTIQNKSRKMFRTADNARNINGVLLSPTDLKILDRSLYKLVKGIPRKMISR